jgi:hypothetical protein
MSSVIERAIAQFENRPTHTVEVPEWGEGGKPLVVHFRTPNAATLSKVNREADGDPVKQACMLVAQAALDEKSSRMFTNMNWKDLFDRADPGVTTRIANAIMEHARVDEEAVAAAEKN